jgi:GWxTD domain-containing protein
MKTKIKFLFILLFLFSFDLTLRSEFRFDYDYCVFKSEDSRLYLEFYYSFYQNQLQFIKTTDGYEADGYLNVHIINKSNGSTIVQQTYKVPILVPDTIGYNKNNNLTGQVNYLVDSGQYSVKITVKDYNNTADSSVFEDNLSLSRFSEAKVALSCVQISNGIEKTNDTKNIFYKNTLEVVPNPLRLFGSNLSTLYYYFEIYNLSKDAISENYSIITDITDLNDAVIKTKEKKYVIKNNSKVEIGTFDISDLKTNPYKLVIKVLDNKNIEVVRNQKKFLIFNADSTKVNTDNSKDNYLLSEFAKASEENLDKEFSLATYIASDKEKDQYEIINNLEGKRKFMFEFWKGRDISRKDYLQRITQANNNYHFDFTDGWKTDRGRVFVIYGLPDEVERFPFESDKRAYEIWHYNSIQGGVIFVFVDMSNSAGDYGLAHSTARKELRNDDWERRLRLK